MRRARQLNRRRLSGLLVFLSAALCQSAFSKPPAGQSQPKSPLRLTAEIISQSYCGINPSTFSLQLRLRLRYTNLSSQRLIIYQGHDLFYQTRLRSDATATAPQDDVMLLDMHYFDEEFERIDAASPGRVFVKLAPGDSFEREIVRGVGVTNNRNAGGSSVQTGPHSLRVIVSTWYQSPQLAEKLRQEWQRKGLLWTQPLVSEPLNILIQQPPAATPCH